MSPGAGRRRYRVRQRGLSSAEMYQHAPGLLYPTAGQALNLPPAQVAGEAFASNRADGQVDVYYFL